MTTNFMNLANQFGTTKKLLRGKPEYTPSTMEGMRSAIIEQAKDALSAVRAHEEKTTKNPMIRKIRNGLSVKIGYGKKNETLVVFGKDEKGNDEVELKFFDEERNDAIKFLEEAIASIEQGGLDAEIQAKLDDYRSRAEKGKVARRKVKLVAA